MADHRRGDPDLMIMHYTREAGVRNLEREIANVLRKAIARKIWRRAKRSRFKITPANVNQYLGIPKFRFRESGAGKR
ncbi:MAG: hypothetical protein MPW15_10965 [Candidatus Manganitrophus sp.]|nr:hypothetical protein [Candidatus Manganitrophus sp.]